MALLAADDTATALATARRWAHASPDVGAQLDRLEQTLPAEVSALAEEREAQFAGETRFASAFVRQQWELRAANGRLRCLFTWRRGSGGWRLNQWLCARP